MSAKSEMSSAPADGSVPGGGQTILRRPTQTPSNAVFTCLSIQSDLEHSMSDSATDDPTITLYRLQACPFCERVVRKLDTYDISYQSRFVEPMHSDRDVVKRLTGKRTVPAIVDENTGVTMSESANIVDYLDSIYGAEA